MAHAVHPAGSRRGVATTRNLTRHFLICPDRHRIP
ncbi:hypothetical protein STAFG_1233 [Streptomyces afghaniensis 772]|uniref:Uncharacterized protein n=1 Tax=Streptomyces afghaniensis 772 TaxID=1283301 RepID=S4MQ67_9ACTN|nr:hypothetical protein STAFG_1233 [Streptomyces afghaniensis 772]